MTAQHAIAKARAQIQAGDRAAAQAALHEAERLVNQLESKHAILNQRMVRATDTLAEISGLVQPHVNQPKA